MMKNLDTIRQEILAQLESEGAVNVPEWTSRYPDKKDEILEFAFMAEAYQEELKEEAIGNWTDKTEVVPRLLNSWRTLLEGEAHEKERRLALKLSRARRNSSRRGGSGRAPKPFKRAVVFVWVLQRLVRRSAKTRISRFRVFKTIYFLETGLGLGLFADHKKMSYGPYDPSMRYRDAEPIALKKNWIGHEDSHYTLGESVAECMRYAPSYLVSETVASEFVDYLSQLSRAELETWATIHSAMEEVLSQGQDVTLANLKGVLRRSPEWLPKLSKRHFRDEEIENALGRLRALGLFA